MPWIKRTRSETEALKKKQRKQTLLYALIAYPVLVAFVAWSVSGFDRLRGTQPATEFSRSFGEGLQRLPYAALVVGTIETIVLLANRRRLHRLLRTQSYICNRCQNAMHAEQPQCDCGGLPELSDNYQWHE